MYMLVLYLYSFTHFKLRLYSKIVQAMLVLVSELSELLCRETSNLEAVHFLPKRAEKYWEQLETFALRKASWIKQISVQLMELQSPCRLLPYCYDPNHGFIRCTIYFVFSYPAVVDSI